MQVMKQRRASWMAIMPSLLRSLCFIVVGITLAVAGPVGCASREVAMPFHITTKQPSPRKYVKEDFTPLRKLLPRFPAGYQEYLMEYGYGVTGDGLTVLPPQQIVSPTDFSGYAHQRRRLEEYWFWDGYGYEKSYLLTCIPIASCDDGDHYFVHPTQPDLVIELQHEGGIHIFQGGIIGLLSTMREAMRGEPTYEDWSEFRGFPPETLR
jgi:hypothetical protein